eukprot:6263626-Amphidinium_carterae.1
MAEKPEDAEGAELRPEKRARGIPRKRYLLDTPLRRMLKVQTERARRSRIRSWSRSESGASAIV